MSDVRKEPYERVRDGLRIYVKLVPHARVEQICGREPGERGPHLKVKVRSQPEKGKANLALLELIAKWLFVSKSDIVLLLGQTSRLKQILIRSEPERLEKIINEISFPKTK